MLNDKGDQDIKRQKGKERTRPKLHARARVDLLVPSSTKSVLSLCYCYCKKQFWRNII